MENRFQCFDTLRKQAAPFKIISFEDYHAEEIGSYLQDVESQRPLATGAVLKNVLILRDPFNQLASKMANPKIGLRLELKDWPAHWMSHAQLYLNPPSWIKESLVAINYNQWLTNENYRKLKAEELQLEFTDKGFEHLVNFTWGHSSFGSNDNQEEHPQLSRWRQFEENTEYSRLLEYPQLKEMAGDIFDGFGPTLK